MYNHNSFYYFREVTLLQKLNNDEGDCTSACLSSTQANVLYTSVVNSVCMYDVRNFQSSLESYQYEEEEINHIVFDESEKYLATCDDS